jgi:hypothetical protein
MAKMWAEGFKEGLEAIKYYGGATVGMRTMLDSLEPGILALQIGGLSAGSAAAQVNILFMCVHIFIYICVYTYLCVYRYI